MKSLCCIDSIGMHIVSLALRVRPLFLPLLFVAHCPTCVAETGRFLWFSDLHYDPFYGRGGAWLSRGAGCAFDDAPSDGQVECDAPLALINSALRAAKSLPPPDFILVTGDLSRHGTDQLDQPEETLVDIFNAVAQAFKSAFPRSSLVFCLGNNDAIADYYLDVDDPKIFRLAMNTNMRHILAKSEVETFRRGGFYSRPMRNNVKIIALNTVIYSMNHQPRYSGDDPLGQFAWLETKLSRTRQEGGRVMIVGHIPPTIGSFRRAQFWQNRYLNQYLDLIEEYSDIVSCQLFGHLHSDEFRLLPLQNTSPIFLGSSITPIFGGNPSFRVVYYDDTRGDVENYDSLYLDLSRSGSNATWKKLYSFREAYGVTNMSTAAMRSVVDGLPPNTSPIFLGSSITPIFGGNPSFRVVYYDDTRGDVENYDSLYLDLSRSGSNATWKKLYSFREAYGVTNMSTAAMRSVVNSIAQSGDELDTFISNQRLGAPQPPCDKKCAHDWTCILTSVTVQEYNACAHAWWYKRLVGAGGHRYVLATVIGVFAAFAVVCLACYYKRRKKQKQYEDLAQEFNISDDLSLT